MKNFREIALSIGAGSALGVVFGIAGALVLIKPIEKVLDKYEEEAYQKVWNGGKEMVEGIMEIIEEEINNG